MRIFLLKISIFYVLSLVVGNLFFRKKEIVNKNGDRLGRCKFWAREKTNGVFGLAARKGKSRQNSRYRRSLVLQLLEITVGDVVRAFRCSNAKPNTP